MLINLEQSHLELINKAVSEMPFKEAAPLISYINEQIKKNQTAEEEKNRNKN